MVKAMNTNRLLKILNGVLSVNGFNFFDADSITMDNRP